MRSVFIVLLSLYAASSTALGADSEFHGQWKITLERPQWEPKISVGSLEIHENGRQGRLRFDLILFGKSHEISDLRVRENSIEFTVLASEHELVFRGTSENGSLSGKVSWKNCGEFEWSAQRTLLRTRFDSESIHHEAFPRARSEDVGVNDFALDALIEMAEAFESDSLVVIKDGRLVCERYFGRPRSPIEAMSATKSVVAIALALAVQEGDLPSLDSPVSEFYPEWSEGMKQRVTVRHLLTQTSGLEAHRTTEHIYASPDFVRYALEGDVLTEPGSKFFYNNRATNLLAGIIREASGVRLDEYLEALLFEPLGIEEWTWTLDRAENPHGMSGLQIHAIDLAKIGQLLLDQGLWKGERILGKSLIEDMIEPIKIDGYVAPESYGNLWWLTPHWTRAFFDEELFGRWKTAGAKAEFLERIHPLINQRFGDENADAKTALFEAVSENSNLNEFMANTSGLGERTHWIEVGPIAAYSAQGYLGQWLVVVPESRVIVVRQRRYRDGQRGSAGSVGFGIVSLARELVR